jgi:uncharacterized protein involved in exopolysaccharide biosynthesis
VQPIQAELTVGMSVRELLAIAFREKRKIVVAAAIPPIIAVLMLLNATPMYRAETGLVIKTGREYIAAAQGQNSALGPTSTLQEEVNTEIQIMTSRGVLEKVITKIGLANIYPEIGENVFRSGTSLDRGIEKMDKSLAVDPVKLSNVLAVTFEHENPKVATQVLTGLIDAYQSAHLEVYAGNRAHSYQDGIQRDIDELDHLEHDRAKLKVDNGVYDIALQRAALIGQRSDAQTHLQDAQTKLITLQKRLTSLHTSRSGIKNNASSADTTKSELEYLQNTLSDLRRNELALGARLEPNAPQVQQLRDQIGGVETHMAALSASLNSTKSDPVTLSSQIDQQIVIDETEYAPLQSEITEYTAQIARIGDELERIEKVDTDLRVLADRIESVNGDLKVTREAYESARALDEMDRAKIVSVSQIQPVMTPEKPASPRRLLYLTSGLLAGLLMAVGVVVMALAANNTFVTAEGTERLLRIPVLVTVPKAPGLTGRTGFVAG